MSLKINKNIEIKENEILADYAHTQVGGPAEYFAIPKNMEELQEIVKWANEKQIKITVFGKLSNVVIRDGGIKGLVILLTELNNITIEENDIIAETGADLIQVCEQALQHNLTGLEWGAGIPGSVGGAVFMNAGAYGGQSDMVIKEVTCLMPDGKIATFVEDEIDFGYRHSVFQDNHGIILTARFKLEAGNYDEIRELMDDFNFKRVSKQPLNYPSMGSVFKRPEGYFAGKLITDCQLKGKRIGGVEVSKKHAGFMVNVDNGTASDYEQLIKFVQDTVFEEYGVQLETEVRIIGEK